MQATAYSNTLNAKTNETLLKKVRKQRKAKRKTN